MLRGGLDPALHLVATPQGRFGNVTIANRLQESDFVTFGTGSNAIKYVRPTVAPTGKTDFLPHLGDVALLRAFQGYGDHGHIASVWIGEASSGSALRAKKDSWTCNLAAQFRARGVNVLKPVAVAYPTRDVGNETYLFLAEHATVSPDPATLADRILTFGGFFGGLTAQGLPPFALQKAAYALSGAFDTSFPAATQSSIIDSFAAANLSADETLGSVLTGPAWPPSPTVLAKLGLTSAEPRRPLTYDPPIPEMFACAFQALSRNLSHVIGFMNMGFTGPGATWDSHKNNISTQRGQGNILWPALGKLVKLMKETPSPLPGVTGKSMFDTTNIWVQSEMGRTPGPDVDPTGCAHWPAAQALFMGGRFKRGVAVGGFTPDFTAKPINLVTGADGGQVVRFNNLIATVMKAAGGDPTKYTKAAPVDALLDMSL